MGQLGKFLFKKTPIAASHSIDCPPILKTVVASVASEISLANNRDNILSSNAMAVSAVMAFFVSTLSF